MKNLLIAVWLMAVSSIVYASCSTTSIITDKGMTICTSCCSGSNCTITCL